jgi:hypothetical protein
MTKKSLESQQIVKKAMHKFKCGTLKSGISGTIVKSRKQAIAVWPRSFSLLGEGNGRKNGGFIFYAD